MNQYLLATFHVEDAQPRPTPGSEEMQVFLEGVNAVEEEMDDVGVFVFGGALCSPDASTTLRNNDGEVVMTDGPFAEAKEQVAGFYIINAEDLDEALEWGSKVTKAIGNPIEVRPFRATGRVQV